jgi:RES domain-containing protein
LKLWRITTPQWALDRRCDGARLHGGRWNPPGLPVMYAGTSIEIAALEKFVHLNSAPQPPLVLVSIDVPDDPQLHSRARVADLPADWAELPVPASTQEFGRRWIEAGPGLVLLVPSVIVPEASNALINPLHSAFKRVRLKVVRDFSFDVRMRGQ